MGVMCVVGRLGDCWGRTRVMVITRNSADSFVVDIARWPVNVRVIVPDIGSLIVRVISRHCLTMYSKGHCMSLFYCHCLEGSFLIIARINL